MTPKAMADILFTRVGPGGTELSNDDANYLLALLRCDWDVRVLDAWAEDGKPRAWYTASLDDEAGWRCTTYPNGELHSARHYFAPNADAARHAAALAVFPTLPEAVRVELGECP